MKSRRLQSIVGGVVLVTFCCLGVADSAVAHPPPSRKASKKSLASKPSLVRFAAPRQAK